VFSKEQPGAIPDLGPSPHPTMDIITIPRGITNLLQSLKISKAAGPDGITPKFLKTVAADITPCLTMQYEA
jgi:hypothetical protein